MYVQISLRILFHIGLEIIQMSNYLSPDFLTPPGPLNMFFKVFRRKILNFAKLGQGSYHLLIKRQARKIFTWGRL